MDAIPVRVCLREREREREREGARKQEIEQAREIDKEAERDSKKIEPPPRPCSSAQWVPIPDRGPKEQPGVQLERKEDRGETEMHNEAVLRRKERLGGG